jgi:aryl-alcohol dehydrogenase-like predicted oxidoreductase
MTFGGVGPDVCHALLDGYTEVGGNFVDTADIYADDRSEEIVGDYLTLRGGRDRLVVSTKYSLAAVPGDPNAGGNHRKAMRRALEGSLRRLRTDYVDLYIVHLWDGLTPVTEVLRTLDDAVTAGTVRYIAFSDCPAWVAATAQTTARLRGWEPLAALQLEYSLLERGIELEFPAMCQELGMSLMVWGPLANGLLSGKYHQGQTLDPSAGGRLNVVGAHVAPERIKMTDRAWAILAELEASAADADCTMAQAALSWVLHRPAVGAVVVGATAIAQLEANLAAVDLTLPDDTLHRLDVLSSPPQVVPYSFMACRGPPMTEGVTAKPASYIAGP